MAKTSIHIEPIKPSSERHNRREKELDYVRKDLTHLNESWEFDSVAHRLETIKENYFKSTGQRMQKKATPIREGVVVIDKSTSMEDLRRFAEQLQDRFGIKTIQIHIHRDEGHVMAKEWKPNLHAHFVFDWTDDKGKTLKLNRQDMAEIQTILSECTGMERGKSSNKKHLNALQYKTAAEEKRIRLLEKQTKHLTLKYALNSIIERVTHVNEKKTLKNENLALNTDVKKLREELELAQQQKARLALKVADLENRIEVIKEQMSRSSRAQGIEGEKRAVTLINNKLRELGLQIDYRAFGSGYDNCVYIIDKTQRNRGLSHNSL
jgi:hypothetical protein